MVTYLLDTNVLSYIIRKDQRIIRKLQSVLRKNAEILICPVVFYEVARGLYHTNKARSLEFLKDFARCHTWCEFNIRMWDRGASLWAECRKKGTPTGHGLDKDVLIAAQAHEYNAIIVTNNRKHFASLNVACDDWLAETP